jgi:putative phosphoesterase
VHLAIVSDTHIPRRAAAIPESFRERIAAADHVIHAGDFEDADALADIRDLAADLTAVHGNVDPAGLGLPSIADVTLGGVTFVVTHGHWDHVTAAVSADEDGDTTWHDAVANTARARTRNWDGDGIVGVGGHIHEVVDEVHDGVRLLNPGTATGANPGDDTTMLTVEVGDGELRPTVHEA